jgi:hypothetical protein
MMNARRILAGVMPAVVMAATAAMAITPVLDNIWNYRTDNGSTLGDRGDGLVYGWRPGG